MAAELPARVCGDCDACCTVLQVKELAKPGGVPCLQLREQGPGCSIHATRPGICRSYTCLWLSGGLDEEDRPDKLGAILDVVSRGLPTLRVHELREGAYEASQRLREISERYRAAMPVRIGDSERSLDPDRPYRVLLPGGEEQRVRGEEIEVWRDGRCFEKRRLPWLERKVRAASLCFQRVRWRRLTQQARKPRTNG